ncbi:MAG: S8 family serine peptidase [Bifidobacteriaceae bacterium]|nr:S8 family serine peptidase [Bifidobacteriaceae bacterium]
MAIALIGATVSIGVNSRSGPAGPVDAASAPTTPDSAAAALARSGKVRLITGDVVRLDSDGGVAAIEPGPRADGTRPHFATRVIDSQTYVFPSDVLDLIGDQLDQDLFNITELASYELGRDNAVPVIVATASAANSVDLADLGVEVKQELQAIPAQAGQADASTDSGPAASWGLIDAAAAPADPVEKIWLDRTVRVEPAEVRPAALPGGTPAWMELIGADDAWAAGWDGTGVTVAVVDSGVDAGHPDLVGQVVAAQDFTGLGTPDDPAGHGTFVASEIAGTGAASGGDYAGVAPGAKIINARVLDDEGYGDDSAIMAGIEWAAQEGAEIINLSLGDSNYGDGTAFFDEFVNQVAEDYDCLVVVAAGNDYDFETIGSPATADQALSVGATDETGNRAFFSSAGPRRGDGAVNPQIVAPGLSTQVIEADGEVTDAVGVVGAETGGTGYTTMMGTSMATPLVAGAAALLKQADPGIDRHGLRTRLVASAQATPDGSSVFEQGAGLVNIPAALDGTLAAAPTQLNLGTVAYPWTDSTTGTLTYVNDGAAAETLTLDAGLTSIEYAAPGTPAYLPALGEDAVTIAPLDSSQVTISETTLTVPAGGSAAVDVTIDTAPFGVSYVGGYVTATAGGGDVIRTPIGLANEPQRHELTVTATDKDGQPLDDSDLMYDVFVLDLVNWEAESLTLVDGQATVDRVAGTYIVVADGMKSNAEGGFDETLVLSPIIELTESTSVALDGTAAKPVTAQVDQLVEGDVTGQVMVSVDNGEYWSGFGYGVTTPVDSLGTNTLYLSTTPSAGNTEWEYTGYASLHQPYVEASFDACGTDPLPIVSANGWLAASHSALTLVDAADGSIPGSAGDGSAALAHLTDADSLDLWPQTVVDWITAADQAGYEALIIDSDNPAIAKMAVEAAPYFADYDAMAAIAAFPVLLTTEAVGTQLVEASETVTGDPLYLLSRGTPEYAYQLGQTFDVSQDDPFVVVGDDSTTAQLTVEHRAMGASAYAADFFFGQSGSGTINAQVPSRYLTHVSPDLAWQIESALREPVTGALVTNSLVNPDELSAGEEGVLTFGSQVQGAWFDVNWAGVTRFDDVLYGGVPLFVDGQGQPEWDRGFWENPDFGAIDFTVTDLTSGDVLFDNEGEPGYQFSVEGLDDAAHTFRIAETTTWDTELWAWSTDVTSAWQWRSDGPAPRPEPDEDGWIDPSSLGNESLRQVWYELPGLDAYNAGTASQPIVLHVSQLPDSSAVPLETVTLEQSTDGGTTWTPVALTVTDEFEGSVGANEGETLYVGTVPAAAGEVVSLKSSVAGGDSSFDQTILNAYPVTDAPQGFPAPVSWNSCGIAAPLPITVSSQVPVAFQAKGAAPNDAVTLALATDDAVWRPDANGEPAVVKVDGAFYGGSASAFAVGDEAPNGTAVLGEASVNVTLPVSGNAPVTVAAPAGFTVPTSQYGVWVWRIDPAGQAAAVKPLIPDGVTGPFGRPAATHVTQMSFGIGSQVQTSSVALPAGGKTAQVCDSVWLDHATAGDLWLNESASGAPVKITVKGGVYYAKDAAAQASTGLAPAEQYSLEFTATGQSNAQTVCHTISSGQAGSYGFQFGINLADQSSPNAQYLSEGTLTALWSPATTVAVPADGGGGNGGGGGGKAAGTGGGKLPVTGANDVAPIIVLTILLVGTGGYLLATSRRRTSHLA